MSGTDLSALGGARSWGSTGSDLGAMTGSRPRGSLTPRGSMMQKQVKGLTIEQVQETLVVLMDDATDFVVSDRVVAT